jgi:hypothetical protein
MAIVAVTYVKTNADAQSIAKAALRYLQHRKGYEGERITRPLFGPDGPLTRGEVYDMIDAAPEKSIFFRFVLSPDPIGEDTEKDLPLALSLFWGDASGEPGPTDESLEGRCELVARRAG